jgi:hypothetical protein
MTIVEITGGMLRAARSLTGLSQQEFAPVALRSRTLVPKRQRSHPNAPLGIIAANKLCGIQVGNGR